MKQQSEILATAAKAQAPAKKAATAAIPKEEKQAAVKKPAATRRKAAAKPGQEVYIQFGAGEWNVSELVERVKADYMAQGHAAPKKVSVYVKPEDGRVYYVVNDDHTGSVAL